MLVGRSTTPFILLMPELAMGGGGSNGGGGAGRRTWGERGAPAPRPGRKPSETAATSMSYMSESDESVDVRREAEDRRLWAPLSREGFMVMVVMEFDGG